MDVLNAQLRALGGFTEYNLPSTAVATVPPEDPFLKVNARQSTQAPTLFQSSAAPAVVSPQTQAASPQTSNLLANIEEQLKVASTTTDTMEAGKALAEVKGAIAKEAANFYKDTQGIAHAEFGVPSLAGQLQQAIQMDDMAPGYRQKYGMADSDETAKVRQQLMTAKSAADGSIAERLAGNTVYQELMAKAKTQEAMVAHRTQRNIDQDANLQAKAEEFYYNIPPEEKKLFDEAIGNKEGDPRKALANLVRLEKDAGLKEQMKQLTKGGEAAIPVLTAAGNVFAKQIAIQREAPIFGSADIAAKKIQAVEAIAGDNRGSLEAFAKMRAGGFYAAGDQTQALEKKMKLMLGPAAGNSAEDRIQSAKQRAAIAVDFAKFSAEQEFNSDLIALRHKSSLPVPAWLEAAAASGKIGKIDKNAAIALVHQAANPQEQQQRAKELTAFYNSAQEKQNKSILFAVSPLATEKLKAEIGLLSVFGKGLSKIGSMLPDFKVPTQTGEELSSYMNQQANR